MNVRNAAVYSVALTQYVVINMKVDEDSSTDDKEIFKKVYDSENEIEDFIKKLEKENKMFTDKDSTSMKIDGGYGFTGNLAVYQVLKRLPSKEKKEYIEELKRENLTQYEEYKEWEREFEELGLELTRGE